MEMHSLNVLAHVGAGALALGVGLVPLIAGKGGKAHRMAGRLFVAIAGINLATATIGALFFGAPASLIAATMAGVYYFVSSLRALALGASGPGLGDALLALAGLALGGWLLGNLGKGTASWTPMIGYSVIGAAMAVALYDLSRIFWRKAWYAKARGLDHGLKMSGAYFAMMSAGFGNVFRDWQPYSQFGPSLVGTLLIPVFVWQYRQNRRRGSSPALPA